MRKWIFLLWVAGAALSVTGCGQLMNLIYPSNVISVDVRVVAANHRDWLLAGSSVSVTVSSDTGQTFTQTASAASFDGTYAHFPVTLTKLPNQKYTLVTSYTSSTGATFYASPAPDDFFDPSGTELNLIQLPYAPGTLSSNGHSVYLAAYVN